MSTSQTLGSAAVEFVRWLRERPAVRQLTDGDPLGRGAAAQSPLAAALRPKTEAADTVARSVCPYCAVGCGQLVYARDGKVLHIEGDPDSPISRGRLCPKGSASHGLVTSPLRQTQVLYRRPYTTDWEALDLDTAFSGFDPATRSYGQETWQYEGMSTPAPHSRPHAAGSHGHPLEGEGPRRDPTLQHPRCVYQILKRHFVRYTPEMVERVCGTPTHQFLDVCRAWTENSGRDRTAALVYSVGWTQRTVGAQYIRTGAIIQLLLGNIGLAAGSSPSGATPASRAHLPPGPRHDRREDQGLLPARPEPRRRLGPRQGAAPRDGEPRLAGWPPWPPPCRVAHLPLLRREE